MPMLENELELIGSPDAPEPIVIAEYDERWPDRFQAVAARIRTALGPTVKVEHIGSTSVPGLAAKPIIDVLLVVDDVGDEPSYRPPLEGAGFVLRAREPGHRLFRTPQRDVHLHIYGRNAPEIDAYLRLRDRLQSDPSDRRMYEATKRSLAQRDWASMQQYADAKTDVIARILDRTRRGGTPSAEEALASQPVGAESIGEEVE